MNNSGSSEEAAQRPSRRMRSGCIASNISVGLVEPGHVHRGGVKGGAAHTVRRPAKFTARSPTVRRKSAGSSLMRQRQGHQQSLAERWSKLVANTMANGVSACTGLAGVQIAKNAAIRHFQARLGSEGIGIRQARGYNTKRSTICRRRRSPAPVRAISQYSRPMTSAGCRESGEARPISGRRWVRAQPRAVHRDRISERLCRARRQSGGHSGAPTSGWSRSSIRSSTANSNRTGATSSRSG